MSLKKIVRMILITAGIVMLTILYFLKLNVAHVPHYSQYKISDDNSDIRVTKSKDYLVYSPQCRIPSFEPWHESIRSYFKPTSLLRCSNKPLLTSVVRMKNGTYQLKIEKRAINRYKETSSDTVKCCYSEISRINEISDNYDEEADNKFRYSECRYVEEEELLPSETEFIRVKCKLLRNKKPAKEVYRDAHPLVPILPGALNKIKEQKMSRFPQTSLSNRLNVLILGIDSVSRLNMRRMMPKTYQFLKENDWIELNGYTKIADNTFPNLMAILSGREDEDIRQLCHENDKKKFDDCPYIWKEFSDLGYVTAYAEDTPKISTFNYLKTGFVDKPTDYYLRPFMLAVHSSLQNKKFFDLPACVGPVAAVDHILNYARRFLETFNDFSHFSLFWMNSLSHNDPRAAGNMDQRIRSFLTDLLSIGTYNNTAIFLISDHGTRFGNFRHSFIAYYEERLPFFFMWFPEWFKKQYPHIYSNIAINQRRLTSPFDVHLTLKRIVKADYADGKKSGYKLPACPKCVSLFDVVPWNRGCGDAAISDVWCVCHEFEDVSMTVPLAKSLASFVAETVDNTTKAVVMEENLNSSVCAEWKLHKIIRIHEIKPLEKTDDSQRGNIYQKKVSTKRLFLVLVTLNPGKTKFEAVIEVKYFKEKPEQFKILFPPSRLDSYFKYTKCVNILKVKYYCYCTQLI